MMFLDKNLNSFLPTLALFAVAAFRILPITNRLIISIQHLRYGNPVIINLINNLDEKIENNYLVLQKDSTIEKCQLKLPTLSHFF